MFTEDITYPAAFLFGLSSFFSGCILPLIPAYFTFITGYSLEQLSENVTSALRIRVIRSTVAFVGGFSLVFILMGASASLLGELAGKYKDVIRIVGGAFIIIFGFHITGVFRIRFLDFEKRVHFQKKPLHIFGTVLVGMAFAAGWSPCVGPQLGSILFLAANQQTVLHGTSLLAVYSIGLAIPFLIISIFINFLIIFIRRVNKYIPYINATAGILLIGMGLLLVTDKLYLLIV
jgi:cytochrome c-type biogenesis protein